VWHKAVCLVGTAEQHGKVLETGHCFGPPGHLADQYAAVGLPALQTVKSRIGRWPSRPSSVKKMYMDLAASDSQTASGSPLGAAAALEQP